MLYHFLHPSSHTSAQPVEGAPQIPGLNPYHHRDLPAAFRTPNDGSRSDDKDQEEEQAKARDLTNDSQQLPEGVPEMFRLILNSDYQGMLEFFITPGQEQIIQMRNTLRRERGISEQTLFRPQFIHDTRIDKIRLELYEVTYLFYFKPLGFYYNIVI